MNGASLDGPRARIGRAVEHFEALDAAISAYVDREPYVLASERNPQGWHIFTVSDIREPPPKQLGLIFGDILHSLRAALDNLAWQLVLFNDCQPRSGPRGTAFPICFSWQRFQDSLYRLCGAAIDHIAFIEALQPYEGRNEPIHEALRIVHRYSNIDKHQTIHPTLAVPTGDVEPDIEVESLEGPILRGIEFERIINEGEPVDAGAEVGRVRIQAIDPPKTKVKMKSHFVLEIAFGEARPVLLADALPEIGAEIGALIEHFAPSLDG